MSAQIFGPFGQRKFYFSFLFIQQNENTSRLGRQLVFKLRFDLSERCSAHWFVCRFSRQRLQQSFRKFFSKRSQLGHLHCLIKSTVTILSPSSSDFLKALQANSFFPL